jgi:hypothetical protein
MFPATSELGNSAGNSDWPPRRAGYVCGLVLNRDHWHEWIACHWVAAEVCRSQGGQAIVLLFRLDSGHGMSRGSKDGTEVETTQSAVQFLSGMHMLQCRWVDWSEVRKSCSTCDEIIVPCERVAGSSFCIN